MPYRFVRLGGSKGDCWSSAFRLIDVGRVFRVHADGNRPSASNVGVSSDCSVRVGEFEADTMSGQ